MSIALFGSYLFWKYDFILVICDLESNNSFTLTLSKESQSYHSFVFLNIDTFKLNDREPEKTQKKLKIPKQM